MTEALQKPRVTKPSEFKLFSNLPSELRLKIWTYALPGRIVELCQAVRDNTMPFYSPTTNPSLLSVNHESRTIALENYILSFPNDTHPAQIYFSPSVDTLFFPAWCWLAIDTAFGSTLPEEMKDKVRRVAIEELVWCDHWGGGVEDEVLEICEFKNLEEVVLVVRDPGFPCPCFPLFVDGPERGVLEFVRIAEAESEYYEKAMESMRDYFESILQGDPERKIPELKVMRAKRDGVLV
jgi:hypothetical protein